MSPPPQHWISSTSPVLREVDIARCRTVGRTNPAHTRVRTEVHLRTHLRDDVIELPRRNAQLPRPKRPLTGFLRPPRFTWGPASPRCSTDVLWRSPAPPAGSIPTPGTSTSSWGPRRASTPSTWTSCTRMWWTSCIPEEQSGCLWSR